MIYQNVSSLTDKLTFNTQSTRPITIDQLYLDSSMSDSFTSTTTCYLTYNFTYQSHEILKRDITLYDIIMRYG